MKILIITEPDDPHAVFVQLSLEDMGHGVTLLFPADQPTRQKNAFYIDNNSYLWKSDGLVMSYYDVVWWRRPRKPYVPRDETHPDDYQFVVRENEFLYESLTNNMAPHGFWINPKAEAQRANSKLFQLKKAAESGLLIPMTLCANDPNEIRYFVLRNEDHGVVYKPLSAGVWVNEGSVKLSYTAKIDFFSLPENELLQLTPGIFQRHIRKQFELRVVCFGTYLMAVKLLSQVHPEGKTDWRAIPVGRMTIEPYRLPQEIELKILNFMRKMGLVFGSLDMIVTPEGDHIFLEVNEQGQFLWLEAYNPELRVLDAFTHFILNRSIDFRWDPEKAFFRMEDYQDALDSIMSENMRHHVHLAAYRH